MFTHFTPSLWMLSSYFSFFSWAIEINEYISLCNIKTMTILSRFYSLRKSISSESLILQNKGIVSWSVFITFIVLFYDQFQSAWQRIIQTMGWNLGCELVFAW